MKPYGYKSKARFCPWGCCADVNAAYPRFKTGRKENDRAGRKSARQDAEKEIVEELEDCEQVPLVCDSGS